MASRGYALYSSLTRELSIPRIGLAFLLFIILAAYTTYTLLTLNTVFDLTNIFINAGVPTDIKEIAVFSFRFDQLYILLCLQFAAAYLVSAGRGKHVNALLLAVNVFLRLLFALHLPVYFGDIFRNELYGELAARGYNPYSTYQSESIPLVREYDAAGLPTYMWPQFTFTYPTFTATYFLALCLVFPGFGYWQEVFLLFVTSMLDVLAALLISKIHGDGEYRYAVIYSFFPPVLNMALNGQIEAIPNFLTILSYYFLVKQNTYKSVLTLVFAFQSKYYPLAWLLVILYRSREKVRSLLFFVAAAALLSIPFLASPEYFTYFREMVVGQPYFQTFNLLFLFSGIALFFTRRNIMYTTMILIFAVLCAASYVAVWYYLWIIPTIFILMKKDRKISAALMLYLLITNNP